MKIDRATLFNAAHRGIQELVDGDLCSTSVDVEVIDEAVMYLEMMRAARSKSKRFQLDIIETKVKP